MDETSQGGNPQPQPLKQIRTFQGDVAEALGRQNESLVSIQRQAAAKRDPNTEALEQNAEKRRKDFLFLLFGSIFLLVVGAAGAWYGYQEYLRRTAPPILSTPENRFIAVTSEFPLDVTGATRESFAASLLDKIAGAKDGEFTHVLLTTGEGEMRRIISTTELLNILESKAPGSLVRAFDKLFMFGTMGQSPFIIIKLASFENAFPGMLEWERDIPADLRPIFTKANTAQDVFKDVVYRNKDVRVLTVGSGSSTQNVLMYSFFDNKMLIITESRKVLETLLERLSRERLSR